tara:strand:- start:2853 stop:3146 length:294 start_codon:yes stop_codon:yes gene_type:complete
MGSASMLFAVFKVVLNASSHYALPFFAVLAARLNAPLAGAPFAPFLRIVSPLPALMRFFFAAMFPYKLIYTTFLKFHCGAQSGAASLRQSNQRLTGP